MGGGGDNVDLVLDVNHEMDVGLHGWVPRYSRSCRSYTVHERAVVFFKSTFFFVVHSEIYVAVANPGNDALAWFVPCKVRSVFLLCSTIFFF